MTWADAVPNLLIGLREGLEAGLVVSILLAALRRAGSDGGRRVSSAPLWLGVIGALALAGSFAAVLTYSIDALSTRAQQAVSGLLSVLAVVLVTAMIFWMRRAGRTLAGQLRGELDRALVLGAGALTLVAFLAVGREALETTLFIWTAIKASGTTAAPLIGAGLGLTAAAALCRLLYQQAVRLNLGTFFNRSAVALIVIAAGVLSYGLGDLQEAGWLAGRRWVAFDLTAHIDPTSWWASLISGVTELGPRMTVLQALAWVTYLAVVTAAFVRAGHTAPAPASTESAAAPAPDRRAGPGTWERLVARRPWVIAGALVAVPAVAAATVIAVLPAAGASATIAVTVTSTDCAPEWRSGQAGTQNFAVTNKAGHAAEIVIENSSGGIVAEIETLGPATTGAMSTTLDPGSYTVVCHLARQTVTGAVVAVSGARQAGAVTAVRPVTVAELVGPNTKYQHYAARVLAQLAGDAATLRRDLAADDLPRAKADWLTAQLDWERVGASYGSFGADGAAVDGLPDGLPNGVHDSGFTGLHRLEYGLYHGQRATELLPVARQLSAAVATVRHRLGSDAEAGDPTNLPLRVHEILEDAQRDHLSGIDDHGAHARYALTYADVQVTRAVLSFVAPLVQARSPRLVSSVTTQLDTLQSALLATRLHGMWQPSTHVPRAARQRVNAALGAVLESLSAEPTLLEVPPNR